MHRQMKSGCCSTLHAHCKEISRRSILVVVRTRRAESHDQGVQISARTFSETFHNTACENLSKKPIIIVLLRVVLTVSYEQHHMTYARMKHELLVSTIGKPGQERLDTVARGFLLSPVLSGFSFGVLAHNKSTRGETGTNAFSANKHVYCALKALSFKHTYLVGLPASRTPRELSARFQLQLLLGGVQ